MRPSLSPFFVPQNTKCRLAEITTCEQASNQRAARTTSIFPLWREHSLGLVQQAFVAAGNPFTARVGDQDSCVLQQLAAARRAVTRNPIHIASVYRSSGICDWRLGCRLTDLPTSRFADSGQPLFDIDFATHCHIETPLGRARLAEHPCLLAAQNTPLISMTAAFRGTLPHRSG